MKLYSHRGNLDNVYPLRENVTNYIEYAIKQGFNVEVDVWSINDKIFLGHDGPTNPISHDELLKHSEKLLIHCKNPEILHFLTSLHVISNMFCPYHFFWHENDRYTLTNRGIPVIFPGQQPIDNAILMKAEHFLITDEVKKRCYGLCSDYISYYKG